MGWLVQQWSRILRFMQTGRVQGYAMFILVLVVVFGLAKIDFAATEYRWPELTVIFLGGVSLLVLMSRYLAEKKATGENVKHED